MNCCNKYMPLFGRICLSVIFFFSGVNDILNFEKTAGYMTAMNMPAVKVLLVGAIVFRLVGAVSIAFGIAARFGALLLLLFMVSATLVFHSNLSDQTQLLEFMKNLAIMGGLLLVIGNGAGAYKIYEREMK